MTNGMFPVSATAPDVTHEAVDIEQASGAKIIVEYSAGTTCKSSGRVCEDKRQHTRDAKSYLSFSLKFFVSV